MSSSSADASISAGCFPLPLRTCIRVGASAGTFSIFPLPLALPHLIAKAHLQFSGNLDLFPPASTITGPLARVLGLELLAALLALPEYLLVGVGADGATPGAALGGERAADLVARVEAAELAAGVGLHEAAEGDEGGADAPGGLPGLLVVPRDAETDLAVGLEAAARGGEAEGGRVDGTANDLGESGDLDDRIRRSTKSY